jgi:hypothetical protein
MVLDDEQYEILNIVSSYCQNLDVSWNKFKGDVVCRIIEEHIRRHLPANLTVVGPNVYLNSFPYEFDLLIVHTDAKPRELTSSFSPVDARCVLEIKKGGVYSAEQPVAIAKIFNQVVSKYSHVKCAYLTIEEVYTVVREGSKNFYQISKRQLGRHGFFALGDLRKKQLIPGEWTNFINYILNDR